MSSKHMEIVETSAQLVMQMQADVRALKATVFFNMLTPSDHALVVAIKASTKEYRAKTESNPGHPYGAPDVWVWRAAVAHLKDALPNVEGGTEALQKMAPYFENCVPATLARCVYHAKLVDTYKQPNKAAMCRLEVGVAPDTRHAVTVLGQYVESSGGGAKFCDGKPPRGKLERDLAKLLVQTKVWTDKAPRQPQDAVMQS